MTAIRTDHHAITLEIDSLNDQQRGPSFWKFNNSLLDDAFFVERLRENFPKWMMNDIYPGSSTHPKVVFREVLHPIELE